MQHGSPKKCLYIVSYFLLIKQLSWLARSSVTLQYIVTKLLEAQNVYIFFPLYDSKMKKFTCLITKSLNSYRISTDIVINNFRTCNSRNTKNRIKLQIFEASKSLNACLSVV